MKIQNKIKHILYASCISSLFLVPNFAQAGEPNITDTISFMAHGMTLNAIHQPITATPQIILNTQNQLLTNLEKQASKEQVDLLRKQKEAVAAFGKPTDGDSIWTNALMIDSFLGNSSTKQAVALRRLNFGLLTKYASLTGFPITVEDLNKNILPSFISDKYRNFVLPNWSAIPVFNLFLQRIINDATSYNNQCKAAGVPVPPSFVVSNVTTDFGGKIPAFNAPWIKEGQLPANRSYLNPLVANSNQFSMVYSYKSTTPQGFCLALPIVSNTASPNPPNVWNAFGIICQSITPASNTDKLSSQSKACFWDNNGDIKFPAKGATLSLTSGNFVAPPDLPSNNICTDCHAGENAFNIHPGTVLETAKNNFNTANSTNNFITRNNWYTPLVDSDWPQNPEPQITNPQTSIFSFGTYPNGNGLCSTCHHANYAGRLPDVAQGAFADPSGVAGGWPARDNHYKFCTFMLPNYLTTDTSNGALSGDMSNYVGSHLADVATLYSKCNSLFTTFTGSTFAPNQTVWKQNHVLAP